MIRAQLVEIYQNITKDCPRNRTSLTLINLDKFRTFNSHDKAVENKLKKDDKLKQLQDAIQKVKDGEISAYKIELETGIARSTISNHARGKASSFRRGRPPIFTKEQERLLLDLVITLAGWGYQIQANTTFIKTIQARAAANQPDGQVVDGDYDEDEDGADNGADDSLVPEDQVLDVETIAANITPEVESDSEPAVTSKSPAQLASSPTARRSKRVQTNNQLISPTPKRTETSLVN